MKKQFRLSIANEDKSRTVGVTEILLTEKLFELNEVVSYQGNGAKVMIEERQHHISKALGERLSPDSRARIANIQDGRLHLSEIH